VNMGNGAVRMRTAERRGSVTLPQDVIVGGILQTDRPAVRPRRRAAPRGVQDRRAAQRHVRLPRANTGFHSANIIEEWIRPVSERRRHPLERLDLGSLSRRAAQTHIRLAQRMSLPKWKHGGTRSLRKPHRPAARRSTVRGRRSAGETTVLGPFTGVGELHPANKSPLPIKYYGTDLGWSYEHRGQLQFLFGDTAATEKGELIEASSKSVYDDGFGTIDLKEWPDPARITPQNIPLIRLGQNPGTTEMSAINPGHALESFKTPLGGFSNGRDEFGLFYASKPQACRVNGDCSSGFVCDAGLGYIGERPDVDKGTTVGCVDGSPRAMATRCSMPRASPSRAARFCTDPSSTAWADTEVGRISGMTLKNLVGIRSTADRDGTRPSANGSRTGSQTSRRAPSRTSCRRAVWRRQQDYRVASGSGGNRACSCGGDRDSSVSRAGPPARPLLRMRTCRPVATPVRAPATTPVRCGRCPTIQPQRAMPPRPISIRRAGIQPTSLLTSSTR
jgi:hypothetical protein